MSIWIHMCLLLLLHSSSYTKSTSMSFEEDEDNHAVTKMNKNALDSVKVLDDDDFKSVDRTQQTFDNNLTRSDIDVDSDDPNDIDIKSELPVLLERFCPGSDVCTDTTSPNESSHIKTYSSCCRSCSCSDDCEDFRNCCFPTSSVYLNHCYPTFSSGPKSKVYGRFRSFFMVDTEKTIDDEVSETPCGNINISPWGSLYPVYSRSKGEIYKNSLCAKAHGVNDTQRWKAFVTCRHGDHIAKGLFYSATTPDTFTEVCDVWFEFPGNDDVLEEHECFNTLESSCPEPISVQTLIPHVQLKSACNSGPTSPYRGTNNKVFKNVFCAICNKKYNQDHEGNHTCTYAHETGRFQRSFTAMIDIPDSGVLEINQFNRMQQACIIDAGLLVNESCRSVLCPSGQNYNSEGMCVFMVTAWYDNYIEVNLQLISDVLLNMTDVTVDKFTSPWPDKWQLDMLYYFPIDDSQPNMTNKIIAKIAYRFKIVYPSILIKRISIMKNSPWTVEIGKTKMRLEADLMDARDDYKMYPLYEYLLAPSRESTFIYSRKIRHKNIIIDRMSYCRQIEIKANEFKFMHYFIVYNNITGKYLVPGEFYFSNFNGEKSVKVCIENSGFNIIRVTNGSMFSYIRTNVCCLILLLSVYHIVMIF